MVVQVASNHFLAGTRIAQDQHRRLGIGHLLHHLAHRLDRPAGADQAAEQVGLALMLAQLLVKHLAVDLSSVEDVQQLVVGQRQLGGGQQALTHVIRPTDDPVATYHHHRNMGIPGIQLFNQTGKATGRVALADDHALDGRTGANLLLHQRLPVGRGDGKRLFPQEFQDQAKVMTALGRIIELKSLKQYVYHLRNITVSYERLINVFYDHLMEVYEPERVRVVMVFNPRGGISSKLTIDSDWKVRGGNEKFSDWKSNLEDQWSITL